MNQVFFFFRTEKGLSLWATLFLIVQLHGQGLQTAPSGICLPGVSNNAPPKGLLINYVYLPEYQLYATNPKEHQEVQKQDIFEMKLKFPIVNRPAFKLLGGLHYGFQSYAFDQELSYFSENTLHWLDNRNVKMAEATLYGIQSLNSHNYLSWRMSANWRGDWAGFFSPQANQFSYSLIGLWGKKPHEDLEYGFGFRYSHDPGRTTVLPFAMYNRTFNNKWGIETTLPVKIMGRYNVSDGQLLYFGAEYTSNRYFLNQGNPDQEALRFHSSNVELSGSFQQRISSWTWLEFKAGYALDFNSTIEDPNTGATRSLEYANRLVGSISFFVSPPKKKRCKSGAGSATAGN